VKKAYSTKEAARQAGVHWVTLLRWQGEGKVSASEEIGMNGGKHWRWTAKDIVKIKKYKREHFREGQGRRKKKVGKNI
jgi:predicted site-specific integrase-resolvase